MIVGVNRLSKVIFIAYFGKLNNYFNLWLRSCSYQKTFTFYLFTDDKTEYQYPSNVHPIYISFDDLRIRIQQLFDFPIHLPNPYKLCDYKVAYGDIFAEYVGGFDYWGYADLDVIFGRLETFLPDFFLNQYDKISECGHFTLFRNTDALRHFYRQNLSAMGFLDHREVFSSDRNFSFDEHGFGKGINFSLLAAGYKVFLRPITYADIVVGKRELRTTREEYEIESIKLFEKRKKHCMFLFSRGTLLQYAIVGNKICSREEMYIHLQKRPMINRARAEESFIIAPPNRILNSPKSQVTKSLLKRVDCGGTAAMIKRIARKVKTCLSRWFRLPKGR